MKILIALLVLLALALTASPADAQRDWSFELRAGVAVPTQDLGDAQLDDGLGFEGTVAYRLMPHLSAYAGWDWLRFAAGTSFAGQNVDFEETGYAFGAQFEHPFRGEAGGSAYRVRVGATLNHIEVEDAEGEVISDSGHGLGWEVGTGVIVRFGDVWRVTPGVRYRSLARTLTMAGTATDVELTYVALEMGFSRRF